MRAEGWDGGVDGVEGGVFAFEHEGRVGTGRSFDEEGFERLSGGCEAEGGGEATSAVRYDFGG